MSGVYLTARGLVCAFGTEDALWQGLVSGESRVDACPELLGAGSRAARVPEGALSRAAEEDRTLALAVEAALQIRESPAWRTVALEGVGVCIGTTQGPIQTWEREQAHLTSDPSYRPRVLSLADPARRVAEVLGAGGPIATPSMACVSGSAAIGLGLSWLERGLCSAVVAGGVDALSKLVGAGFTGLRALDPDRARPFDVQRAGLSVGEGAALVLLQRGRPTAGAAVEVAGFGLSTDAHHLTAPDPSGVGLARAISTAITSAGLGPEEIEAVNAHGTGTVFNDLMEAKALQLALGARAPSLPLNSIKGAIGHTMAAAGAIEAVLCAGMLERGMVPPTVGLRTLDPQIALDVVHGEARSAPLRSVLSTSSGFGGINTALLFRSVA